MLLDGVCSLWFLPTSVGFLTVSSIPQSTMSDAAGAGVGAGAGSGTGAGAGAAKVPAKTVEATVDHLEEDDAFEEFETESALVLAFALRPALGSCIMSCR